MEVKVNTVEGQGQFNKCLGHSWFPNSYVDFALYKNKVILCRWSGYKGHVVIVIDS